MEVIRFARALLPMAAIALLGPPGVGRPAVVGTADAPWDPPGCGGTAASPTTGTAWFKVGAVLDASGTLVGQRLTVGLVGRPARAILLPPESFASGPVGGLVLVGDDDGSRSRLRVVDPARGCATAVAIEAAVIRGAIVAPSQGGILEHRVDRATRADLGVWRRPVDGGTPVQVLAGLAPDERHGRTFGTDLFWASDGRLAVASCGDRACRTRVVDPATGIVSATVDTGIPIGVVDGRVVAYAPCDGYPCGIVATDLASGSSETLVGDAGPAVADARSARVAFARSGGVTVLDLRTRAMQPLPSAPGLEPVATGIGAGVELAAGDVLLAPSGRLTDPAAARRFDISVAQPALELLP